MFWDADLRGTAGSGLLLLIAPIVLRCPSVDRFDTPCALDEDATYREFVVFLSMSILSALFAEGGVECLSRSVFLAWLLWSGCLDDAAGLAGELI